MIKSLVNGYWEYYNEEELQPGTVYFRFESGPYETLRTKNYKPIFLKPHLDCLFFAAKKNHSITYSNSGIKEVIPKVLIRFHIGDQRAIIIVTPKKFIMYTTELNLDQKIYDGTATITVSTERRNPTIKTTNYKNCLNAYKLAPSRNCFEAILPDKKRPVLERSRSNIFWVIKNSLFTRKDNVLPVITRRTIIQNSPYSINYSMIKIVDFRRISELFLINNGSGIIPVLQVNFRTIVKSEPGLMTLHLLKSYDN